MVGSGETRMWFTEASFAIKTEPTFITEKVFSILE